MLRILLFPFSIIYSLITFLRNYLYDNGLKPSTEFDIPVICVGNLTAGGTGKTPMIEYLIRLLSAYYSVATLSRGYGRNTRGFRMAGPDDDALTLGDEPYQFYKKYGHSITVSVGEDRAFAIPNILQEKEETQVILLDDAFQHRRVKPLLNILLSDYNRPFYKDFVLPAGRLRESRYGARRADAVVITKCPPEISEDNLMEIEHSVTKYVQKPLFFSSVFYGTPVCIGSNFHPVTDSVILVTGIADPKPLSDYVRKRFNLIEHICLADHHKYSLKDLHRLNEKIKQSPGSSILTTEKDGVKLESNKFREIVCQLPLFYLPIEVKFLKNGRDFDELVLGSMKMDNRK